MSWKENTKLGDISCSERHCLTESKKYRNKHTLLLPVLQQKLTSQLLNNTARKAEGESGSRKAEGLAVEIDRKSIYEVEEEMQQ